MRSNNKMQNNSCSQTFKFCQAEIQLVALSHCRERLVLSSFAYSFQYTWTLKRCWDVTSFLSRVNESYDFYHFLNLFFNIYNVWNYIKRAPGTQHPFLGLRKSLFLFWSCPQHGEVPGPGAEPALQQWLKMAVTMLDPQPAAPQKNSAVVLFLPHSA